MSKAKRRVLTVVMDGVGERKETFGNAVALAHTPFLHFLKTNALYTTLKAHGTFVGLPSDADIGNSEVGHNALGAGRIFDQGAKLVQKAIENGDLYKGPTWQEMIKRTRAGHTLHFLGLLSDGNVHSHERHLYAMLKEAAKSGVKRIRVHVLFDGRDVAECSAEIYIARLEQVLQEVRALGCDAEAASGGGRMRITMDRYEADWSMVERGWHTHALGEGRTFPDLNTALTTLRSAKDVGDQYLPEFVLVDKTGRPKGPIEANDAVILFNFRGDRAIEISRAFEEADFKKFNRKHHPQVLFAGMMEYDGDLHIPKRYLVRPPLIADTLGEYLCTLGQRQFACSETQKFGHVTYFWNGNRSGYFDKKLEEYVEITSDLLPFDEKPWMKAYEITETTIAHLQRKTFDFARINYANGDMVGHTGDLDAAVLAVSTVDLMIGRLIKACQDTQTILLVTADHGNCDEMFDASAKDYPDWQKLSPFQRPKPKTSHTLAEVPFYLYDPCGVKDYPALPPSGQGRLSNIANTVLALMGLPQRPIYDRSLLSEPSR